MEITIAVVISIIGCVISVSSFVLNRKDKAVNDSKENHQGLIEYQLKELKEDVKEILSKLEKYETDTDDRINKAIDLHIKLYHNNTKKEVKK